jgi:hypothetical protein
MQYRPVRVSGGDTFIAFEKVFGLVGIAFGAAHL